VVVVIVRIDDEPNGLVRGFANLFQNILRTPRIVGIDYHDVVIEYDPDTIGGAVFEFIAKIIIDAGGDFRNGSRLGKGKPRSK
jgi:hypothetical protein